MKPVLFVCLVISVLHGVIRCDHHKDHGEEGNKPHDHNGKEDHDHNENEHQHQHPTKDNIPCHKIAEGNADFAFRLYKQISKSAGLENVFFSPSSISTALGMLLLGAKSTSHDQIVEGLGFNLTEIPEEEVHTGFQHLQRMLNNPKSELQLSTGSALFIQEDLKVLKKFTDDAKSFYESDVFSSNFMNETEAKKQINGYVEKKTHGKIVDLLESIDQRTVMVLVNYIFFKGNWKTVFNSNLTKEDDFFVDEKTTVKVPMMEREGTYLSWRDPDLPCSIVRLDYEGNASAFFVLPDQNKMKEVEEGLSVAMLKKWRLSKKERTFTLHIPKFSISATSDLRETLIKLGMAEVFSDMADLSRITGQCNLKASKAVHKAVLRVDEQGTEAAAATAVEIKPRFIPPPVVFNKPFLMAVHKAVHSMVERDTEAAAATATEIKPQSIPPPILFNRPFVLVVESAGVTLFKGKLTNPTKALVQTQPTGPL